MIMDLCLQFILRVKSWKCFAQNNRYEGRDRNMYIGTGSKETLQNF